MTPYHGMSEDSAPYMQLKSTASILEDAASYEPGVRAGMITYEGTKCDSLWQLLEPT